MWSVRQAIMNGADYESIEIKCIDTTTGKISLPCDNCDITFKGKLNLSKEEE